MRTEMTASVLSLAGAAFPGRPRFTALERAKAAHSVGIGSIGVTLTERLTPGMLRYVSVPEAEWIDLERPVTAAEIDHVRFVHEMYGVWRVNIGACNPQTTQDEAVDNLRKLTSALPEIRFAVEPVAFGAPHMYTPEGVRHVLALAGSPSNAGVLHDFWQVSQNSPNAPIPGDVAEIQVCGTRSPEKQYNSDKQAESQDRMFFADDTQAHNLLSRIPAGVPVSYEVPRAEHRYLELPKIAQAIADDMSSTRM